MWLEFLEKARTIGIKTKIVITDSDGRKKEIIERHFGTVDLAGATGLSAKDASAWISKFIKWGYAKRVGSKENIIKQDGETINAKPLAVYALTDYGRTVEPNVPNRLQRLIKAVKDFQGAPEGKAQVNAMVEMFRVCGEVENTKDKPEGKRSRAKLKEAPTGAVSEVVDG